MTTKPQHVREPAPQQPIPSRPYDLMRDAGFNDAQISAITALVTPLYGRLEESLQFLLATIDADAGGARRLARWTRVMLALQVVAITVVAVTVGLQVWQWTH